MSEQMAVKQKSRGVSLGRVAGIQISLDYSWFIIFFLVLWSLSAGYFPRNFPGKGVLLYWLAGGVATLLFFVSVLIHELSHSLMAIRLGIQIPEINLFLFGGVSRLSEEPKDPKTELMVAVVGPLSSFLLAAFFWLIKKAMANFVPPLVVAVPQYLAYINFALGVFNLIPGFPLDGGRMLRAVRWWKTGSLAEATKLASDMGKGFAVALMILGGVQIFMGSLISGMWLIFIGIFLRTIAEGGYQQVVVKQSLEDVCVEEVMVHEVITVAPSLSVKQLISEYFLRYGYKGFPVLRDGELLGVVSIAAVKNVEEADYPSTSVEDIMVPFNEELTIDPAVSLAEALRTMSQRELGRLLVMEEGRLVGMITKTGLLRFLEIKRILEG